MNPTYDVKIGNVGFAPTSTEDMEAIETKMSMDVPADSLHVTIRPTIKALQLKQGDAVSAQLGYDSKITPVFSGLVDAIEVGVSKSRIFGLSPIVRLLKARIDQPYIRQSAGDIVKDLCNKTGVPAGEIKDGVSLPSFFLSHERPAFDYVVDLARVSGYDVYFTPENKLVFRPYQPSTSHKLAFGEDVLKVDVSHTQPIESVSIFGESPSSSRGSDTTHWLTKDEVKGSSGSGEGAILMDPTIKDTSTANAVAKSIHSGAKETTVATIVCIGRPEIKLGEAVNLQKFPIGILSGGFKVRTVEHSFSKRTGFRTRLVCSKEA